MTGDTPCDHNCIPCRRWHQTGWICVRCSQWFKVRPRRWNPYLQREEDA